MERVYIYCWGNNEKRATMKGRLCRVLARGKMNSCLIEFIDNGQREIISRNAVRKAKSVVRKAKNQNIELTSYKKSPQRRSKQRSYFSDKVAGY